MKVSLIFDNGQDLLHRALAGVSEDTSELEARSMEVELEAERR